MPGGRPPGINPETTAAILAAIRVGAPLEVSAQAAGIPPRTFWDWMRKGDEGKEPYAEFSQSVRTAEAEVHVVIVANVRQMLASHPSAALQWMKMRWSQFYLDRSRVDMSVDISKVVKDMAEELGLDEAQVLAEAESILGEARR